MIRVQRRGCNCLIINLSSEEEYAFKRNKQIIMHPALKKVGGILLLACLFLCSFVRSSRFLVHSITLEPCMPMF